MGIKKRGSFDFEGSMKRLSKTKSLLPKVLGAQAVNHFHDGFDKGGFTDQGFKQWQRRKKRIPGGKWPRWSKTETEPSHLKGRGKLRNSVQVIRADFSQVKVGSRGVPYALIHNEGLQGKVFGKIPFKMPKRQFVGDSEKLFALHEKRIVQELDKVLGI